MNQNSIKSEIIKGLKNGKSKDELYEEYSQTMDDNLLRRALASTPSTELKEKFRTLNKTVCWILILFFALELLGSLESFDNFDLKGLFSLAISAYLIIQLWKFNGDVYLPTIFWLIWGMLNSVKELSRLPKDEPDYQFLLVFSWCYGLILFVVIVMIWVIRKNVFAYYNWFKPALDDSNRIVFQKESASLIRSDIQKD
jgi:hypothetical protein